ncbi:MAG: hypothetical protein QOD93_75 [Acetobacteraceae bacterium]|nr:hypothetical protein [Acetobacteraceae bacterium]
MGRSSGSPADGWPVTGIGCTFVHNNGSQKGRLGLLIDDFSIVDRPLIRRISRLYDVILCRGSDPEGLRVYVQGLRDGRTLEGLAAVFLDSDEFRHRQGTSELHPLLAAILSQTAGAPRDAAPVVARLVESLEAEAETPVLATLLAGSLPLAGGPAYPWWEAEQAALGGRAMQAIEAMRPRLAHGPMISLVAVVENPDIRHLREMIESVRTQLYGRLELLLVVSRWSGWSVMSLLRRQAARDSRIRLVRWMRRSGPAGGFNEALRVAAGEFVGSIGLADRLGPAATLELADAVLTWPDAQIVFTDEDALTAGGITCEPQLKADWDAERMLVQDQLGRLSVFRTALLRRIGGAEADDGAFDLGLRAAFAVTPDEIRHIPRVLYHRREPGLEPAMLEQTADAFVRRTGLADAVLRDPRTGMLRVVRRLPVDLPLVSAVIPTRDRLDLLRPCIEGLLERTVYPRLELVIVDHDSREAGTLAFLGALAAEGRAKVIRFNGPFNWSAMNNCGVGASAGDVVILLNNDTMVMHADWLDEMVVQALRPEVGLVGAKLLYPLDGTVQHAGIVLRPDGAGQHVFRHAAADDPGYLNQLAIVRTVSAVTGACMAMRRQVFDAVGGLEEDTLRVTNGDVDLCLRVQQHGYRVLWTPFARLWHGELATRGADDTPEKRQRAERERAYLVSRWAGRLVKDPYWSPNLEVREDGAILAVPSRARGAWERNDSALVHPMDRGGDDPNPGLPMG